MSKKLYQKKSNVDIWLERETHHKRQALENASLHFDRQDALTVNTLEAIYGQESSFGKTRGKRYLSGATGDFQLEKRTATRIGLTVSKMKNLKLLRNNGLPIKNELMKNMKDAIIGIKGLHQCSSSLMVVKLASATYPLPISPKAAGRLFR